MGKNRIILSITAVFILFTFGTTVLALTPQSEQKVQQPENNLQSPTVYANAEPTGNAPFHKLLQDDTLVSQNQNIELYLNKSKGTLKLKDKSNGYIWSSTPQDDKLTGLNNSWKEFARSLIALDYVNADGKVKRLSSDSSSDSQYEQINDGFRMTTAFEEEGIKISADFTLSNGRLVVSIPKGVIQDNPEHSVCEVYVLPFFGAVREDSVPGYTFVPDGCGALIHFNKGKKYVSPYQAQIYGTDAGVNQIQEDTAVPVKQAMLPVFGMSHGGRQNAFLATAEKGAEYGKIVSYPAGVTTPFNWSCFSFVYRNEYFQKTDKENGGYSTYSKNPNVFDVSVSYSLLSGQNATYSGMAVEYRENLAKSGELCADKQENGAVPLMIEPIMSEVSPSVFGTQVQVMTNVADVKKWQSELSAAGIHKLTFNFAGWEKGGVNGCELSQNSPQTNTGNSSDYNDFVKTAAQSGSDVFFTKNIMSGYENQININHNGIVNIDGTVAQENQPSMPMFKTLYFNNTRNVMNLAKTITTDSFLKDKKIAFDGTPSKLYSDYNKKNPVTRSAAKEDIRKSLSFHSAQKQAINSPNAYSFRYASTVFDTPISGSGYLYALDYVPFYQIVLSSSATMYSPFCNFIVNSKADVLHLIDFGVYPSYLITEQASYLFAKTNLNGVFSSQYNDWKSKMIETYGQMDPLLSKVSGKKIIDRETPLDGVAIVTYDGNIRIGINYNNKEISCNGVVLAPLSATIIK